MKCCTESNLKITLFKYSIPVHLSISLLEPCDMYAIKLVLLDAQLCSAYIHTYPHYGIISATVDVAIKKPKERMMDFHGLSLRPLVVKGLMHFVKEALCFPQIEAV